MEVVEVEEEVVVVAVAARHLRHVRPLQLRQLAVELLAEHAHLLELHHRALVAHLSREARDERGGSGGLYMGVASRFERPSRPTARVESAA